MTTATGATTPPTRTLASRRRTAPAGHLGALLAVAAAVFLALPVATLVIRAAAVLSAVGGAAARAVADALVLSLLTTAASLVLVVGLGLPLAWWLARRPPRGAALVETLVDLPIVLPPSVAGLALLLVFGRRGLLGEPLALVGIAIPFTTVAVVVAQAFVAAPFFVRAARAGIRAVDRDLEDAARVDGAAESAVVRHVTIPLAASALSAGLVMAWARALGEFGATIMFAGNIAGRTQTLPLLVYSEFQGSLDASLVAAAILAVAAAGVLVAVRLGARRAGDVTA
ncbi:MAG: ABC transporter permease [Chloroflexi bacterium]|nr:ABC transporter permease [Chloroflexota bacterium]